jgi:anhydro-N-acetylmuramic acid kinase
MTEATDAPASELYLGLMSGTSADGIDAALVRFEGQGRALRCRLVHGRTFAWDGATRARLVALGQGADSVSLDALGALDATVAQAFAEAALALLQDAGVPRGRVRAIGSHGQTIRHRPHADPPFTWQLGDGNVVAERSGQGAPLMPAFHAALLGSSQEDRAVLNLGGIANFTLLPVGGEVRGFDTGPANALMDAWCERHTGRAYDADGAFAASGQVNAALLARLLAEPWFALPPPKSTGREHFHLDWLQARMDGTVVPAADVQATLLDLTARTVADALQMTQPDTRRVLVCGGGVRNAVLMARLAAYLPQAIVESTALHGLEPDYVEAMGFAWLARETLAGRPGNLPAVTGASGRRVLGTVYPA